jgi:SagB-type dehydrogenase family enzyme
MDYPKDYRKFLKADWYEFQKPENQSDQAKGLPRPPVEKPYSEDAKLINLIAPADITIGNVSLFSIINQRRSRRRYTSDSLSLEELSFLLWSTQGVEKLIDRPGRGTVTLRTVPSGGSLHPFETYLIINRVTGIEPGLYRYLPLEHKLLFIRSEPDMTQKVAAACCGQDFIGEGAVIFIWTTIPYRGEWRYTVVAHKSIATDAGHMCQNLYLAAEAIGAGTCGIGAYFQDRIDAFLGIDGEDEFAIYIAPVGKIEAK